MSEQTFSFRSLALLAASVPMRTQPRDRPHGQRAERQRWRAGLQAGHPSGARILKSCVLAVRSVRSTRVAVRSLRASGPLHRGDSGAPIGRMARTERWLLPHAP
jgi:hypothetical protein